jgi:hypothetical protein
LAASLCAGVGNAFSITRIEGPRSALAEQFSLAWKRRRLNATGKAEPWGGYLSPDRGKGGLYLPSPGGRAGPSFLSIA